MLKLSQIPARRLNSFYLQKFHKHNVAGSKSSLVEKLSNAFISKQNLQRTDINDSLLPPDINGAFDNAMAVCNTIIQDPKFNANNDYKLHGFKIAATSPQAQAILKVDHPFLGPVLQTFDTNKYSEQNYVYNYNTSDHNHTIGIECEFGFILNEKIESNNFISQNNGNINNTQLSVNDVLSCVDYCIPTIEVAQTRIIPFMGLPYLLMASDMAGSGLLVINTDENGGKIGFDSLEEFETELTNVKVECIVNNEVRNEGTGLNVLKSPLFALQWALNQLLFEKKQRLKKGDIISTGTCTGLTPVEPGDSVIAKYSHPLWKQAKHVRMSIL